MLLSDNAFTLLDLPLRFTLEQRELERKQREAYVARSSEGAFALEAVNEAYRCLKDPVTRAELLFDLRGWSTKIQPTPALLERVFTAREAIEQAKARGDAAFLVDWIDAARASKEALCLTLAFALDEPEGRGATEQVDAAALLEDLRYLARALTAAESALSVVEEAAILP